MSMSNVVHEDFFYQSNADISHFLSLTRMKRNKIKAVSSKYNKQKISRGPAGCNFSTQALMLLLLIDNAVIDVCKQNPGADVPLPANTPF